MPSGWTGGDIRLSWGPGVPRIFSRSPPPRDLLTVRGSTTTVEDGKEVKDVHFGVKSCSPVHMLRRSRGH